MKMNLKKKLKYTFGFILMFGFIFLWETPVFADTQIYPIPPDITPYGDGAANITNAGWTNTHLLGQSFIVPADINKITKVSLTNFKLGAGAVSGGGSNKGGIVSVALFAGEPGVSPQCWNRGMGGNECTNVIVPSGARIVKKEKVYIGDNQVPNQFNDLCGWNGRSYPDNNIITYLLKRMSIDPDKPCPKKSELIRMWNLFNANGWTDLTNEWINGRDYPCGEGGIDTCSIEGWWNPNDLPASYGGSVFLWPDSVNKNDLGAGATYFEGPGWTTQSDSWQGWDSAGNYIDVTLPDNTVVPGQTYFISIQQSHTNPNNDPDRNTFNTSTDEYYEEGQWNCENPNEAINVSEPGYITIPWFDPSAHFCGQGNVFVALLSQNDPSIYPFGRAYINSDKSAGDSNMDVTNLTIWGAPAPLPAPAAIIAGPTSGISGQNLTFNSQIFNAQSGAVYVTRQDGGVFTCPPAGGPITGWCLIRTFINGSSGSTFSSNFTFQETGAYWVVVNAFANPTASFTASKATECTGNPSYNIDQWSDCGPNDNLTVNISNPVISTAPACSYPANGTINIYPKNLTFYWGSVAGATSYNFRLWNYDSAWNWLRESIAKNGLTYTFYEGIGGILAGNNDYSSPINLSWGSNYRYRVQASNSSGAGPWADCNFSTAVLPTLSSLYIKENTADAAVGEPDATYGTSGLRSNQGGSNYYNSLKIRQSVSNGNNSNTDLVGTAFTAKGAFAPTEGTLYSLTNSAWLGNGFMLVYAVRDSWAITYNLSIPGGAAWKDFYRDRVYFYQGRNSGWYSKLADGLINSFGIFIPFNIGAAVPISLPGGPIFSARLLRALDGSGSGTWGTWGYLKDAYDNESGTSLTPINGD